MCGQVMCIEDLSELAVVVLHSVAFIYYHILPVQLKQSYIQIHIKYFRDFNSVLLKVQGLPPDLFHNPLIGICRMQSPQQNNEFHLQYKQ
jgi:hypothetical protein